MPTLQEDLETAVNSVKADSEKLHDVVHGNITTEVSTDNGNVKSVAKAIAEIGDVSQQATRTLNNVISIPDNLLYTVRGNTQVIPGASGYNWQKVFLVNHRRAFTLHWVNTGGGYVPDYASIDFYIDYAGILKVTNVSMNGHSSYISKIKSSCLTANQSNGLSEISLYFDHRPGSINVILETKGRYDLGQASSFTATSINEPDLDIVTEINISGWRRSLAIEAGTIGMFASNSTPYGWLKANGSAISRVNYADLFSKLGTLYGSGDGSTTFNLPDLRGEFPRFWDNGRGVDSGRGIGTWQSDLIKSHRHNLLYGIGAWNDFFGGSSLNGGHGQGAENTTHYTSSNGTNMGSETRPRNVALLACIKY